MNLKKKISKKIGILGGTFDPPHKGHLTISIFAIKKLKLDFLIWGVTKKNPFKKNPIFSLKKRLLLSKKIVRNNKKIKVHSYDKFLKSSETIKLIKYLKKKILKTAIIL
jgi:nicotinate-nucleotide adenylyltransferase